MRLEQGSWNMSTTQQDKPGSKSRQRRGKAEQRGQKQDPSTRLEQNDEQAGITAAAIETAATDAAAIGEAAVATFAPVEASVRAGTDLIGQAAIGHVEPDEAPSINPARP